MPIGNASKAGSKGAAAGIKRVPASVQLLETRLKSHDPEVREQAWKSIVKLGAPEEPLIRKCEEQLHHENWYIREAGIKALAYCVDVHSGEKATAVVEPHLVSDDTQQFLRYCAGQTLLCIEDRCNVMIAELKEQKRQIDMMANPPEGKAEELLEKIAQADVPAQQAVAIFAQRLTHENPKIRQYSLDCLSRTDWRCVQYATNICSLVTDPDVSVRSEQFRVIKRLGRHLVEGIPLLAATFGHVEGEDAGKMRRHAHRALILISHPCPSEVASSLLKQLEKVSETPADTKINRLATLECFQELGEVHGQCGKVNAKFLEPVGKPVAKLLEDKDPEIRMTTIRTIIAMGKAMEKIASDVKKKTKSDDPDISRAAIATLRGLGHMCPKVPKIAHKDLEEDPTLRERQIALEILAGAAQNINGYLDEMVKCLEDKDWDLRRRAIESLADLEEHAEPAAAEVARRLMHNQPDVRRAAAETLGRMGIHAGEYGHKVETLRESEEDEDVKRACENACEMLYAAGMARHTASTTTSPMKNY